MAFLEVKNLYKNFGETQVLKGVSFNLDKGEVLSIIGSSGNGKTTLLRCLNFLETPDGGEIIVDEKMIFPFSAKDNTNKRLTFGLVFQNFNLFPQYNALRNVTLAMDLRIETELKAKKKLEGIEKKAKLKEIRVEKKELLKRLSEKKAEVLKGFNEKSMNAAKDKQVLEVIYAEKKVCLNDISVEKKECIKELYKKKKQLLKELKAKKIKGSEKKKLLKELRAKNQEIGEQLLKRVGLADKMKNYPCELSGGQQQRVAIARALALSPDILCFDEPTSALDPELTGEVLKVIRGLVDEGRTIIIVTHEMDFAKSISDKVIFMADGKIEEMGTPEEIFDAPKSKKTQFFLQKLNEEKMENVE